jgi:hypothetical protein
MTDQVFEKVGLEEIFESDAQLESVLWHLLNLLGGKITIPDDSEFWESNVPADGEHRVVLRKEDGKLVFVAERLSWT